MLSPKNVDTMLIFREIWIEHCYEVEGADIPVGGTVVDIGANVGFFTARMWWKQPRLRVIAVEPSPLMCSYLRRNISANRIQGVSVLQAAGGATSGEATLYCRGMESLNTLCTRDMHGSDFRPLVRTPVVTLEELFLKFSIATCDLLKLDCEGSEYEILYAAPVQVLRRIRQIVLEYHLGMNEHTPEQLRDFLRLQGFHVRPLVRVDVESGYLYANRASD